MVLCVLPKHKKRVRFPYLAPEKIFILFLFYKSPKLLAYLIGCISRSEINIERSDFGKGTAIRRVECSEVILRTRNPQY